VITQFGNLEGMVIRQDDVVMLQLDGRAVGTEDSYYIKADGLEPDSQPLLYAAAFMLGSP